MMSVDAKGIKKSRSSSPLANGASNTGQLKAFRYEEAHEGVPPVTVKAVSTPRTPVPKTSKPDLRGIGPHQQQQQQRPFTSPNSSSRNSPHLPSDIKRDSAFAPSISTATRTSYAESHHSSLAGGAAKEPSLPTIVVQDDEPVSPSPIERSRLPFSRKRSKDRLVKASSASALGHNVERQGSFKGIDSNIPSGSLDDLDLGDLVSDKINFSKRGSLLFGGKKMNPAIETPKGLGLEAAQMSTAASGEESEMKYIDLQSEDATKPADSSRPGLQAGRRKPSVQMLQAATEGGRVLSAEETSFSIKVRSMYDAGDERGAQWMNAASNEGRGSAAAAGSVAQSNSTPDMSIDEVMRGSATPEQRSQQHPALRAPVPDVRASYMKETNELAGGIEDWDEVKGEDVDRYGFISPKTDSFADSSLSGLPGEGTQRVATSLRFEAQQPRRSRRLQRNPSTAARSSRSVPPQHNKDTNSLRSFQSQKSSSHAHSTNPFRSRNQRTVAEASDMLTVPPGLEDIREQDSHHSNTSIGTSSASKTASALKRREFAREEKWQKMAQPVRSGGGAAAAGAAAGEKGKGGGMQFTFDTTDPKVISRTWKGIPDRWRATAWHSFLSASAAKRSRKPGNSASSSDPSTPPYQTDEELISRFHELQSQSSADDVQIDMDVPRTINMHIMFRRRYRGGQRLLFHVLHAISLYFPTTGYVQGMASLAATLLCYYDEEHAFVMLVRLWQLRGLDRMYREGFTGLMDALGQFEKEWLRDGDVAVKLKGLGVDATAYGTRWYLTLFNMSVPFPAQLRVWDVFMLLGDAAFAPAGGAGVIAGPFDGADLDVLHAASAALIDATREIVLDSDFENAMKVLTSFIPIRDEDLFMRVAKVEWRMRKKRGSSVNAGAAPAPIATGS